MPGSGRQLMSTSMQTRADCCGPGEDGDRGGRGVGTQRGTGNGSACLCGGHKLIHQSNGMCMHLEEGEEEKPTTRAQKNNEEEGRRRRSAMHLRSRGWCCCHHRSMAARCRWQSTMSTTVPPCCVIKDAASKSFSSSV